MLPTGGGCETRQVDLVHMGDRQNPEEEPPKVSDRQHGNNGSETTVGKCGRDRVGGMG